MADATQEDELRALLDAYADYCVRADDAVRRQNDDARAYCAREATRIKMELLGRETALRAQLASAEADRRDALQQLQSERDYNSTQRVERIDMERVVEQRNKAIAARASAEAARDELADAHSFLSGRARETDDDGNALTIRQRLDEYREERRNTIGKMHDRAHAAEAALATAREQLGAVREDALVLVEREEASLRSIVLGMTQKQYDECRARVMRLRSALAAPTDKETSDV